MFKKKLPRTCGPPIFIHNFKKKLNKLLKRGDKVVTRGNRKK